MRSLPTFSVLVLVMLTSAGCGTDNTGNPGVPDSLLVGVIVDVYAATARAHLDGTDPGLARAEVMERHGLDTMVLNRTLEHLIENPDSAAAVFQRALDSLIVIQRNLRSEPELDSLKKHVRG